MKTRKKLGEMLLEDGRLTEEQLNHALATHKKANMKLGHYLIANGIVRESMIVNTIAKQLKLEIFDPKKYPVSPRLETIFSSDIAEKHRVVPLKKTGSLLKVALSDPTDLNALDTVEIQTNCEVEPIICTEKDLNAMLGAIYGKYSRLGGVMEEAGPVEEFELTRESEQSKDDFIDDLEVSSIYDMAEEAPVVRLVNSILSQAIHELASDIHISPEKEFTNLRYRVDGKLHRVPAPPRSMFRSVVSRFKILANMDISVSRIPQDGRFTIHMGNSVINVRASTIPTIHGENLVLRLLDTSAGIYSLGQLGMNEEDIAKIQPSINKPYGMILSTGPTGSGKSTSLYSILKNINKPDIHIITIEDPVEYRLDGIRQIQLNRKAGMTFASGLRSILRQDPDVIMVGEIRDAETATIASQAALTGHRVLSTVHTNDAAGAITRLLDMGIEPFLVSSILLLSVAQRLVRKICPNCHESYEPQQSGLDFFELSRDEIPHFVRGKGCYQCMDSGYKGRTGIFEVLIIDGEVEDMILKGVSAREITRILHEAGKLRTLKDAAAEKIRLGITTMQEASSAVMV